MYVGTSHIVMRAFLKKYLSMYAGKNIMKNENL